MCRAWRLCAGTRVCAGAQGRQCLLHRVPQCHAVPHSIATRSRLKLQSMHVCTCACQAVHPHALMRACRTNTSSDKSTHTLVNNKVWLAQWGVSHWGNRVQVTGWEAHDCTRGANVFGQARLSDAVINGRSDNLNAEWVPHSARLEATRCRLRGNRPVPLRCRYPGSLADLAPIAGFQWYDNSVMTILSNVTFK